MPVIRVNVRTLAEFALEQGDLMPAQAMAERMQEGTRTHQLRQSQYADDFAREVSIKFACSGAGLSFLLYGRMDGVNLHAQPPIVEEIKTTRCDPRTVLETDHPVYWAQAYLYAHMLCRNEGLSRVAVRLVYVHPNGDSREFVREMDECALQAQFDEIFLPYAHWMAVLVGKKADGVGSCRRLVFPYAEYRDGQRAMAAQAYRAQRDTYNMLIQAPTGIGKTAAALFSALKAMGEGLTSRIFYLTARTTARRAAEDALRRMREQGLSVRAVTLTAKEKICPHQATPCDPVLCPQACGYYDRRRDALREALSIDALDRDGVIALAEKHTLCPFELQLDVSESCDVIICDYNYAFDPVVQLRRFFQTKSDAVLLIDEAHNLPDRARDMLSAHMRLSDFRALLRAVKPVRESAPALYEATSRVVDLLKGCKAVYDKPEAQTEPPVDLIEAAELFLDAARPYLGSGGVFGQRLQDAYFICCGFIRSGQAMNEDYRTLYIPQDKDMYVRIWCCAPQTHLRKVYAKVRAAVLFSATLSPMAHYYHLLGLSQDAGDMSLDLPSPFPPENLLVAAMAVDTRYAQRAQTVASIAQAILALARAKPGNYLACFPSYAYLALVRPYLEAMASDVTCITQERNMSEAAREQFLGMFSESPTRSLIALIALGGVFAEGVDLPGERLSGAAIVGVALPPPSLESYVLAQAAGDEGFMIAYAYPGMERVLQAAGRVIRTETDRGAVLLIDERFRDEAYRDLMPAHWHVRDVADADILARRLARFWRNA